MNDVEVLKRNSWFYKGKKHFIYYSLLDSVLAIQLVDKGENNLWAILQAARRALRRKCKKRNGGEYYSVSVVTTLGDSSKSSVRRHAICDLEKG
jgi:hypothetical protein